MLQGLQALTDKEKQTLHLLLASHEAKSMACHLGLSVHTVNERLRDSRRKLSASSSREAARLLRDAEQDTSHFVGDNQFGGDTNAALDQRVETPTRCSFTLRPAIWTTGSIAMIALIVSLLVLSPVVPQDATPTAALAATPAVQSAQQWLERGDAADWRGSWAATGASFRKVNSLALWTSVSEKVPVPLGAVVSRTLISAEEVPTPPEGNFVVKFRTRFANKADAVETIALTREDGTSKVVGCYID
jgi:DNA-binding CsgD family transcriptional regulator